MVAPSARTAVRVAGQCRGWASSKAGGGTLLDEVSGEQHARVRDTDHEVVIGVPGAEVGEQHPAAAEVELDAGIHHAVRQYRLDQRDGAGAALRPVPGQRLGMLCRATALQVRPATPVRPHVSRAERRRARQ